MENVIIRKANKNDAKDILELILYSINNGLITKVYDKNTIDTWLDLYSIKYILFSIRDKHIYVATHENEIVGVASVSDSYYENEPYSYVSMVYIHPNKQGLGIGRKLLEAVEKDEYSVKNGKIYLTASMTAVKFYQKLGYGYRYEYPLIIPDCGIDFVYMEKIIKK